MAGAILGKTIKLSQYKSSLLIRRIVIRIKQSLMQNFSNN